MSRLYGRLVDKFGFREMREASRAEVQDYCRYRKAETTGAAPEPDELDHGAPREITEEEWNRICAKEKAYAAEVGGPRNPFL